MNLLGLDIGTSGCKATIVDFDGNITGQAYKEYSLVTPLPGWQEIDPELVWRSAKEVIVKTANKSNSIEAISVSSFGEAVIPVGYKGNTLHNSMIYIDSRGQEQASYLKDNLGLDKILGITGAAVHPMYSICKIMWLKQNMPEIYKNTWKFFLFADFILFKLGAKPHTDYSLAARTMAFDVINKKWSQEILDCAGVAEEKFGEPVQSGTIVGTITKSIAEELSLNEGVLLVAGGHDQPCTALGAGVIKNDLAVDGLGTAECITAAFDHPVISDSMASSSFACVPHVIKDMYVTYAFTFTSGSMLKWYRDNFGQIFKEEAVRTGVNIYDLLIEKALKINGKSPVLEKENAPENVQENMQENIKAADLFVLPHFAGAATPYMDTAAKGAIVGLDIDTKGEDIIKAILEGITFEMMVNVERLAKSGVKIDELRVVGGLAKSDLYLQLKADIMGKKVTTLEVSEAGTIGVVILAGTACGAFKSIEDAVSKLVKKKKEYFPDSNLHEIYKKKFETYKRIYPSLKSIYNR